jgi:hypothetical protein
MNECLVEVKDDEFVGFVWHDLSTKKRLQMVTHNVEGLLLCWYTVFRLLELMLIYDLLLMFNPSASIAENRW